jgi:hypothetical protein
MNELRKYQESKKFDPEGRGLISEELGIMILKICTRFSMHPRFYGYSYRDEMVADAVARCLSHAIDKIDLNHEKCNPFSYLTQTCYNCFRQRIKNEKKFMKAKQKYREEIYNEFELAEGIKQTKDNEDED